MKKSKSETTVKPVLVTPMFPFRALKKFPSLRADEPIAFFEHTDREILEDVGGGVQVPLPDAKLAIIDATVGSMLVADIKIFLEREYHIEDILSLAWNSILRYLESVKETSQSKEEWSRPMQRKELMFKFGLSDYDKFNKLVKNMNFEIRELSRELYIIRLDTLPKNYRDMFQKPKI